MPGPWSRTASRAERASPPHSIATVVSGGRVVDRVLDQVVEDDRQVGLGGRHPLLALAGDPQALPPAPRAPPSARRRPRDLRERDASGSGRRARARASAARSAASPVARSRARRPPARARPRGRGTSAPRPRAAAAGPSAACAAGGTRWPRTRAASEGARKPSGHVVERHGHVLLFLRSLLAGARVEVAAGDARAVPASPRSGRARDPARIQATPRPSNSDHPATRSAQHVVPDLGLHRLDTLRDAHRARGPPSTTSGTAVNRRSSPRDSLWRVP